MSEDREEADEGFEGGTESPSDASPPGLTSGGGTGEGGSGDEDGPGEGGADGADETKEDDDPSAAMGEGSEGPSESAERETPPSAGEGAAAETTAASGEDGADGSRTKGEAEDPGGVVDGEAGEDGGGGEEGAAPGGTAGAHKPADDGGGDGGARKAPGGDGDSASPAKGAKADDGGAGAAVAEGGTGDGENGKDGGEDDDAAAGEAEEAGADRAVAEAAAYAASAAAARHLVWDAASRRWTAHAADGPVAGAIFAALSDDDGDVVSGTQGGRRINVGTGIIYQKKIARERTRWDDRSDGDGDSPSDKKPPFKALFVAPSPSLRSLYRSRLAAVREWEKSRTLVDAARLAVREAEERYKAEEAADAAAEQEVREAERSARLAELREPNRWTDMLRRMADFRAEAGHLDLPDPADLAEGKGGDADSYLLELSKFGQELRLQYQGGMLKKFPHLISAVERLGFEWDDFERKLEKMREYKEAHGHCRPTKDDDPDLREWAQQMRRMCKERANRDGHPKTGGGDGAKGETDADVAEDRVARLRALMGPDLGRRYVTFAERAAALREHRLRTGHCFQPDRMQRGWLREFRRVYAIWKEEGGGEEADDGRKKKWPKPLTEERIRVLKEMGVCLTKRCRCPNSPFRNRKGEGEHAAGAPRPHKWERRFRRLVEYKEEHGNLDVGTRGSLWHLLWQLRKAYRHFVWGDTGVSIPSYFVLDEETAGQLREIVGEDDLLRRGQLQYGERLAMLRAHKRETGHCVFPNDKAMASWMQRVRRCYWRMKGGHEPSRGSEGRALLDDERIAKLDEIDFCWEEPCTCLTSPERPQAKQLFLFPPATGPSVQEGVRRPGKEEGAEGGLGGGAASWEAEHPRKRKKRKRKEESWEAMAKVESMKKREGTEGDLGGGAASGKVEQPRKRKKRKRKKESLEAMAIVESMKNRFDSQTVTFGSI